MVPWLVLMVFLFSFAYIRFQWGTSIKNQFATLNAINQPALKWIAWLSIFLAPLWAGIIVLILYSLWLLSATFSDAVALGEVRLHVLSLLGLVATFVGLLAAPYVIFMIFMAERRTRATEESYITGRISDAVTQLGMERTIWEDGVQNTKPNLEVRLGAIYTMERVAIESRRDHIAIMETLCAYIRENTRHPRFDEEASKESWAKLAKKTKKQVWDLTPEERNSVATLMPPRPDIQAALTILGRRDDRAPGRLDYEDANSFVLDLRGSNLAYADLNNSNLGPVLLDDANLQGASLSVAKLKGASLNHANLQEADLFKANLSDASLNGAQLQRSWLDWANFQGARMVMARFQEANFSATEMLYAGVKAADFTGVTHLSGLQLDVMIGDGSTILPKGTEAPSVENWSKKDLSSEAFLSFWQSTKNKLV
jgi:uncharacterized protein YjbI with pentapeptide repeats